jgi:hypothetical protein
MNTKNLIFAGYLLMILVLGNSCIKTLNDQLPEMEPKLVVNAAISPDSILTVNISQSVPVLNNESSDNAPFVSGAAINFYEDGQYLFQLSETENGYYKKPDFTPVPDHSYQIEIEKQGFQKVKAVTTIPATVLIDSFDTTVTIDDYGDYQDILIKCKLKYTDDVAAENYYAVECYSTYFNEDNEKFVEKQYIYVDENEEYFYDKPYGELLWTDKLTNGQTVTIKFTLYPYYGYYSPEGNEDRSVKYTIYFKSLEENYYKYKKSLYLYYENGGGDDPFTEPVLIYTNVEDGLGIFGGCNNDTTSFNYTIEY